MRPLRLVTLLLVVAFVVFPVAQIAVGGGGPNPTRDLPAVAERGEQFNVIVTFHAPADDFHAPCLVDWVPADWSLDASKDWCNPTPFAAKVTDNMVEYGWIGSWNNGTNFTVLYKVTVPCNASLENYTFGDGYLDYFDVDHVNQTTANITGDFNVTVVRQAINFTPASTDFYGVVNGTNPLDQTLELWSSTPCPLNWSLSDDANYTGHDWLSESPTNGSCTNVHNFITLSVNSSGMPGGEYSANITINAPEANNTQEIVPITLHMSVTDVLLVHVSFAGRGTPPNDTWIEPFKVKLFAPGTTNVVWEGNRTTNNTGWFNVSDVVVGVYDVAVKNCTCLSKLKTNVTVTQGAGGVVDFGIVREGDIFQPGDDWVYGNDLSKFCAAWNTKPGNPQWNPYADLNRDGWVYGGDLSLFCANWNQKGDVFGHF